jgi:hypothetical protein
VSASSTPNAAPARLALAEALRDLRQHAVEAALLADRREVRLSLVVDKGHAPHACLPPRRRTS